jgi:small conductance mechanosensitive channel
MEKIEKYYETLTEMAVQYAPKLALAILTLVAGLIAIKLTVNFTKKQLMNKGADPSLIPFVSGILNIALKVTLLVAVVGMVGVKTTSFVAIIGAAGLAIGLALQGSLSNFAGSILILIFKPYQVGDVVEMQGESGVITEIMIFNTKMTTFDNKVVFIPNGKIANDNITNISFNDIRRVDFKFGIGYPDDIDKAKSVFREILEGDARIIKDKGVTVKLAELGDSSVNFNVRGWCTKEDYWDIHFYVNEKVYEKFDEVEGLSIPFPQMDVHVDQEK